MIEIPDTTHIFRMTDDTGMYQHGKYNVPDPSQGYTTDDNARALIMAILLYEHTGEAAHLELVYRYLSFLLYAGSDGWFRNFMDFRRNFIDREISQDCFGRCIWALGFTLSKKSVLPSGVVDAARFLLDGTSYHHHDLKHLRPKAYTLIGLVMSGQKNCFPAAELLADDLMKQYGYCTCEGWNWFEDRLSYCNAVLPWSLLQYYEISGKNEYMDAGLKSLDFLLETTFDGGVFNPVGCNGWYEKNGRRAVYDQQPVEACETLLACMEAHRLTGSSVYLQRANQCKCWYTGHNIHGINMIDPESGGCFDGITPHGPNLNQGAESLISWFIAWLSWQGRQQLCKENNDDGFQDNI